MIAAAAEIGHVPAAKLVTRIKRKIESSEVPEAVNVMRNTQAIRQALLRLRKKKRGVSGTAPKTVQEVVERGVPEIFSKTADGEPFLRYLLILFLPILLTAQRL